MHVPDEIGRYQLQIQLKHGYQWETIFDTKKGEIVSRERVKEDAFAYWS